MSGPTVMEQNKKNQVLVKVVIPLYMGQVSEGNTIKSSTVYIIKHANTEGNHTNTKSITG
jgi:hypothetical protein